MSVVAFPKANKADEASEPMVDFSISGGSVSAAGRMPVSKAIEKIEEITDLLRHERDVNP